MDTERQQAEGDRAAGPRLIDPPNNLQVHGAGSRGVLRAVWLLLFVLPMVPAVSAAGTHLTNPDVATPATLYLHLDGMQDMAISPLPPSDNYRQSEALGVATNTLTCVPSGQGFTEAPYHTYYGYPAADEIDYDAGGIVVSPRRGISYETRLDPDAPPVLHWFFETAVGPSADRQEIPVVLANVIVQATLRAGDDLSPFDEAYNEGEVIASGRSAPALLAREASVGATYTSVDGRSVYEFSVPLVLESLTLPEEGYNLRIDVYVDTPTCPDSPNAVVMPNVVLPHTSPGHRPRLEMSVLNPIRVVTVEPSHEQGGILLHVVTESAWGRADLPIDDALANLQITGPSKARNTLVFIPNPQHCHCGPRGGSGPTPLESYYFWNYTMDKAKPGAYEATMKALAAAMLVSRRR